MGEKIKKSPSQEFIKCNETMPQFFKKYIFWIWIAMKIQGFLKIFKKMFDLHKFFFGFDILKFSGMLWVIYFDI